MDRGVQKAPYFGEAARGYGEDLRRREQSSSIREKLPSVPSAPPSALLDIITSPRSTDDRNITNVSRGDQLLSQPWEPSTPTSLASNEDEEQFGSGSRCAIASLASNKDERQCRDRIWRESEYEVNNPKMDNQTQEQHKQDKRMTGIVTETSRETPRARRGTHEAVGSPNPTVLHSGRTALTGFISGIIGPSQKAFARVAPVLVPFFAIFGLFVFDIWIWMMLFRSSPPPLGDLIQSCVARPDPFGHLNSIGMSQTVQAKLLVNSQGISPVAGNPAGSLFVHWSTLVSTKSKMHHRHMQARPILAATLNTSVDSSPSTTKRLMHNIYTSLAQADAIDVSYLPLQLARRKHQASFEHMHKAISLVRRPRSDEEMRRAVITIQDFLDRREMLHVDAYRVTLSMLMRQLLQVRGKLVWASTYAEMVLVTLDEGHVRADFSSRVRDGILAEIRYVERVLAELLGISVSDVVALSGMVEHDLVVVGMNYGTLAGIGFAPTGDMAAGRERCEKWVEKWQQGLALIVT